MDKTTTAWPLTASMASEPLVEQSPEAPFAYDPATQTWAESRWGSGREGSWCSGSSSGIEAFGDGDTDTYRDD